MGNLKKAIRYAGKNGLMDMIYTAIERKQQLKEKYVFEPIGEAELEKQKKVAKNTIKISILVPAYETKTEYLEALIESVRDQSYTNWELLLCDASASKQVKEVADQYSDERIRYYKLTENYGISGNTNAGLAYATGDYVALLDHDDLLTPDALYEMVQAVECAMSPEVQNVADEENILPVLPYMVYSDEDKCDGSGTKFSCPHRKLDFNLDIFLTNNYICHFTMIRTDIIKELGLRPAYDGAQDYDLFLRVVMLILRMKLSESTPEKLKKRICHVPKILYHWRCHEDSTADNPESKMYAYEAGKRALEDWYRRMNLKTTVIHGRHLGFYETKYQKNILQSRDDIGVIGGKLTRKNKVTGGAMDKDGTVIYAGLHRKFSGYMNRGILTQDVTALDLRCMKVRPELRELYMDYMARISEEDPVTLSLEFSGKVREAGYFLVYVPTFEEKV